MNMTAVAVAQNPVDWTYRRRLSFVALVGTAALWGAIDLLAQTGVEWAGLMSLPIVIIVASVIVWWCVCDGHMRDISLSWRFRLVILIVGLVGVPMYFWRSRTPRDRIRSGLGLGLYLAAIVSYYMGWFGLGFVVA
jgi:hypothetical protein